MHLHILGICGTFMGGIALIARALGHRVSGVDANVYPPMSTLLESNGITLVSGYDTPLPTPLPDAVIIGNALSRGNGQVEAVLESGAAYTSGAQWLAENVLQGKHVLAVAGTHGKTTTTSMLAWILEFAGLHPGFLIGGVAENFGTSARLTDSNYFVIEADEYDTAFFDKRSKFVHYRPRTAILNNLEFDHADIFPDLAAIQTQFHHLLRTVPASGCVIVPAQDAALDAVLARGSWSRVTRFGATKADWTYQPLAGHDDYRAFTVQHNGKHIGEVRWDLIGEHNAKNALAAIAATHDVGVAPEQAIAALTQFKSVRRRLEKIAEVNGIQIYDDFAHHPTAIQVTLAALRARVGQARIIAVLEPRSNTMKLGVHKLELCGSLAGADEIVLLQPPNLGWDLAQATQSLAAKRRVHETVDAVITDVCQSARRGDHILIMSNGSFGDIYRKLPIVLRRQ